jgi:hypothetical protein
MPERLLLFLGWVDQTSLNEGLLLLKDTSTKKKKNWSDKIALLTIKTKVEHNLICISNALEFS